MRSKAEVVEPIHDGHENLKVWHESVELAGDVYRLVANHPTLGPEGFGESIRESASSIPSKIAAGRASGDDRRFRESLREAAQLAARFRSQLSILRRLELVSEMRAEVLDFKAAEIARLLRALRGGLTRASGCDGGSV